MKVGGRKFTIFKEAITRLRALLFGRSNGREKTIECHEHVERM